MPDLIKLRLLISKLYTYRYTYGGDIEHYSVLHGDIQTLHSQSIDYTTTHINTEKHTTIILQIPNSPP